MRLSLSWMPELSLRLPLPYPPSINHYYRYVGGRPLISKSGREYRKRVVGAVEDELLSPLDGRLDLSIDVYPPDRRRRDLDNVQKPLLDALQHAGVYLDDSQIDRLLTVRQKVVAGGQVIVTISPI